MYVWLLHRHGLTRLLPAAIIDANITNSRNNGVAAMFDISSTIMAILMAMDMPHLLLECFGNTLGGTGWHGTQSIGIACVKS